MAFTTESEEVMSESKRAWWTIPETGYNQDWPRPAFALGEMVWWRSDPREGVHVTGISLQEGWQDDKDNTWHDPFWQNGSRSEEHTSELQSHLNLVCRLLLEKKKDVITK